jgi:hypothetical protein
LASEREEQNEAIQSQAGQEFEEEEEEEENNTLWATIMEEGAFSELVGLPSAVVEDIYRDAQPELAAARRRGPRPKLGWLDHLLVIMMLYKLGTTVGGLAARINVKESTLADAITRIRPILNQTDGKRGQGPKNLHSRVTDMWLLWVTVLLSKFIAQVDLRKLKPTGMEKTRSTRSKKKLL